MVRSDFNFDVRLVIYRFFSFKSCTHVITNGKVHELHAKKERPTQTTVLHAKKERPTRTTVVHAKKERPTRKEGFSDKLCFCR
jgi:hypothetical protein